MAQSIDGASGGIPGSIGRYQVIGRIGRSGEVFSAIDVDMGRRVAIKLLESGRERVPTAPLVHRNLVTVFDANEYQGRPYLVMELLDGTSLAEILDSGVPQTLNQKIDLIVQMCDGLQAIHDHGLAHGGFAAHRVFVQKDGSVKLLDVALGAAGDQSSDLSSAVELCSAVLGSDAPQALKDAIAAPHQTVGDLRADIERARHVNNSGQFRTLTAAFERYKKVEALIDERRALGRRLKIAGIDQVCDDEAARLALRFPAFARSSGAALLPVTERDETAALAELQSWHNEQLASVAVLRTASGTT